MSSINFPTIAQVGEFYTQNGQSWQWDGVVWKNANYYAPGPTGPAGIGATGPIGSTGPQGPIGPTGPTGSSAIDYPKISNVEITDNAYTVLDDTAVDVGGGYIKITGTGFATGCQIRMGNAISSTAASSTTYVSSTEVRAQVPAMTAGTYTVYLTNTDGSVAILVNGLTYSASPTWQTSGSLGTWFLNESINIQLSASGATTYSLAAGSSLPSGLTLSSSGLLSGTVTNLEVDTIYSFTVIAADTENQDSPRLFNLPISVILIDPSFKYTTLLLSGDGTNNANNNTFIDSSTNAFTISRAGNIKQGSFSPHNPAGWSVYFDGNGDYLNFTGITFNGDFCAECWFYKTANPTNYSVIFGGSTTGGDGTNNHQFEVGNDGSVTMVLAGTVPITSAGTAVVSNQWNHIAWVRSGTSCAIFVNGVRQGTGTSGVNSSICSRIGDIAGLGGYLPIGYISNARIVIGNSVYNPASSTIVAPTASLTAIASTSLLTCQDNYFKDNSINNLTITRNGDAKITNWSPFAPSAAYSTTTHGGSAYFDGTGDYLTYSNPVAATRDWWTTNWTLEAWVYPTTLSGWSYTQVSTHPTLIGNADSGGVTNYWSFGPISDGTVRIYYWTGSAQTMTSTETVKINQWNHIAFVYNTSLGAKIFVNGIGTGYMSTSGTLSSSSSYPINIGQINNTSINGYVSGLRIVSGTAVYSNNFTPPTTALAAIANTQLLLNFTNAGIYDATTKNNLETIGNTQINTTTKKYGLGSVYFDGNGDWLFAPTNNLFAFGTSDFTLECWVNFSALPSSTAISPFCQNDSVGTSTNDKFWFGLYNSSGTYQLSLGRHSTSDRAYVNWTVSIGTWYHVAAVRSSGTTYLFIDGISQTVTNNTVFSNVSFSQNGFSVGAISTPYYFNGYVDDLRVTNGARYTSTFTPPDKSLPVR